MCNGIHLGEGKFHKVKICIEKTINYLFDKYENLIFVDDNIGWFFPRVKNPRFLLNTARPDQLGLLTKAIDGQKNFVIHSSNYSDVDLVVSRTIRNTMKLKVVLANTTVLLIMPYKNNIDDLLLRMMDYNKVVLIAYDNYNATIFNLIFHGCKTGTNNAIRYSIQSYPCTFQKPITFGKIPMKFKGCWLFYGSNRNIFEEKKNTLEDRQFSFVLEVLAVHMNMSTKVVSYNSADFRSGSFVTALTVQSQLSLSEGVSNDVFEDEMIFTVPPPKPIPHMIALKVMFKDTLWYLIILSFIVMTFAWWCIEKLVNSQNPQGIITKFFEVVSIIILGCVSRIPVNYSLRFLILSYLIYAIHIQTAFKSRLVEILTTTQYESKIQNLEELGDSNLEILLVTNLTKDHILTQFIEPTPTNKTIQKKIKLVTLREFQKLLGAKVIHVSEALKRYSFAMPANELVNFVRLKRVQIHYLKDTTSYWAKSKYALYTRTYAVHLGFALTFQKHVTTLIESGLILKNEKDFNFVNKAYTDNLNPLISKSGEPVVITLSHVYPIFVLWTIGIITSVIAFIGEHLVFISKGIFKGVK